MEQIECVRARRPLSGLSPRDRHALHRHDGMHSPDLDIRTDNDAFEMRVDVSVEDACCTSLRLVRMAVAQLEILGSHADLAPAYRDAVDGVACLGRLACGAIGLVHAALHDELPQGHGSNVDLGAANARVATVEV